MKHLLITRLWFDNRDMMDKYLAVAKQTFIPSLLSQTCKDFTLGLLVRADHVDYVRKALKVDFIPYTGGIEQFRDVVKKEQWTLQSRIDIDDWFAPTYIEQVQKIYKENKDKHDSFVIHAQPSRMDWPSKKLSEVAPYHDTRTSMFSTLCQKTVEYPVYYGSHGQLWKLVDKVFTLPRGMARWVQHEDSVTNARMKQKKVTRVGNMELYDMNHNWISERNTQPVLNVITRTFKRPVSFKKCRHSITSQTYPNINHIVGSEVDCPYYPKAVKLSKKTGQWLPWNLHMNDLGNLVKTGWVMYLDDDDMFLNASAADEIMKEAKDENTLLLWRVKLGEVIVPGNKYFGKEIRAGQISGIGFAFHRKHLPVPWEARRMGDYHVISTLAKKLKVKWIDKVLTGCQGVKNNHGKTPPVEVMPVITNKVELINNTKTPVVTIGTPTWNNGDIFWLSIESLCRIETKYPWEYIVYECPSPNPVGREFIEKYKERLQAAGCVRIEYINKGRRMDLSTKWIEIARHAKGEILIMHDSDDYTHPGRIDKTLEYIGNNPWYDTRYAWHYSITDKKMIMYDYQTVRKLWKTGFNLAIRTDIVRKVADPHKNAGIHKWLSEYVDRKYIDSNIYPCVATTGMNSVSMSRRRQFRNPRPPFVKTNKTIYDIGLPADVVAKLVHNKELRPIEIHRAAEKVEVVFLKSYCRLYKKGDIKRIPRQAYDTLVAKHHVKLLKEEVLEPVNVEI